MLKVRNVFYILLFYRYNTHHGHECHGRFGLLMISLNFLFSRWNSSCRHDLENTGTPASLCTVMWVLQRPGLRGWWPRKNPLLHNWYLQVWLQLPTRTSQIPSGKVFVVLFLTTKIRVWVFGWVKAFELKNTTEAVNYGGVSIMILGYFAASGTESSAILQLHLKIAAGQLKPGHSSKHTSKLVL